MKKIFGFLFLIALAVSFVPAYADELDEQCKTECKNSGASDGHYLAPEPGAKCKDGYTKHPTDEICCCKK